MGSLHRHLLQSLKKSQRDMHIENLKVDSDNFVQSQWQSKRKSFTFLVYRWVLFCIFLCILMTLLVLWTRKDHRQYFLIYFSIWNIILCCISTLLGALLVKLHHHDVLKDSIFGHFIPIYSITSNTSTVNSLLIASTTFVFHGELQLLILFQNSSSSSSSSSKFIISFSQMVSGVWRISSCMHS
jgi:hypothetical protein